MSTTPVDFESTRTCAPEFYTDFASRFPDRLRHFGVISTGAINRRQLLFELEYNSFVQFVNPTPERLWDESQDDNRIMSHSGCTLLSCSVLPKRRPDGEYHDRSSKELAFFHHWPLEEEIFSLEDEDNDSIISFLSSCIPILCISDGIVLVMDATSEDPFGPRAEAVLRECLVRNIPLVFVLDRLDELIIEDEKEADLMVVFLRLLKCVERIRERVVSAYGELVFQEEKGESGRYSDDEFVFPDLLDFLPEIGFHGKDTDTLLEARKNQEMEEEGEEEFAQKRTALIGIAGRAPIVFSSSKFGYSFSCWTMSALYAQKFGVPTDRLVPTLFGDSFFDVRKRKWVKKSVFEPPNPTQKHGFVQFVLKPLVTLHLSMQTPRLDRIVRSLRLPIDNLEEKRKNLGPVEFAREVFRAWLPFSEGILSSVYQHVPSPISRRGLPHNSSTTSSCLMHVFQCCEEPDRPVLHLVGRVIAGRLSYDDEIQVRGPFSTECLHTQASFFAVQSRNLSHRPLVDCAPFGSSISLILARKRASLELKRLTSLMRELRCHQGTLTSGLSGLESCARLSSFHVLSSLNSPSFDNERLSVLLAAISHQGREAVVVVDDDDSVFGELLFGARCRVVLSDLRVVSFFRCFAGQIT